MNLTQIDDIFKATVAADPNFNSYYYGWRSDMNSALPDDGSEDVFPRVFIAASPQGKGNLKTKSTVTNYRIICENIENYGNDNIPILRYWSELLEHGEAFLLTLKAALAAQNIMMSNDYTFDSDSSVGDSRTIAVWFNIEITNKINC